jgi:hypothetical protein
MPPQPKAMPRQAGGAGSIGAGAGSIGASVEAGSAGSIGASVEAGGVGSVVGHFPTKQ